MPAKSFNPGLAQRSVRLRQICLVARDIDWATSVFCAVLDARPIYRDPGILNLRLFNVLIPCGDAFLEIVSPTDKAYEGDKTTAAKLLEKKNKTGCGYMTILQVENLEMVSTRLAQAGAQPVTSYGMSTEQEVGKGGSTGHWEYQVGQNVVVKSDFGSSKGPKTAFAGVQWHPKTMGTLTETDQTLPAHGSWLPAGNAWQKRSQNRNSSVCDEFAGCSIACDEPKAIARRWSQGLAKPLTRDGLGVRLDGAVVRFEQREPGGHAGLVRVDLYAVGTKTFDEIELCGVKFRLVERPPLARL